MWGFYDGNLVGTDYDSMSGWVTAEITVNDRVHPSTASLPIQWNITDTIPNFERSVNWVYTYLTVQVSGSMHARQCR
jgi:hypothetical protein